MDSQITQNHFQIKKNVPELNPGDRIRVHQKIKEGNKERVQVFEGLVIKTQHGRGINGTFTVRRISLGVGVEKTLPLHLPTIVKIEKIRSAKVRRAKLYYVRDLIGKRARRLKKEKEDAAVWEDVVKENPPADEQKDLEQEEAEQETQEQDDVEVKGEEKPENEKEKVDEPKSDDAKPKEEPKKEKDAEDKDKKED
ncbi:MAG: 50S ribosomal protein L19 [candidate division WS2 bacterium ADurb.Bin280]|uniref:Large ribosomal subunit protein bL19 n=1 Tax=candidate division WS2 bacterium ADurb.Bin280 TaxID=1852829 RepID=A0A1V5SGY0_9BACT|nr:MAG: 50S ribosomal protein L19 [candidate division WS2 bacterium ADurb.Bin280]